MQPSEHWRRQYFAGPTVRRCRDRRARSSLADRPVRTPSIEVGNILGQHLPQMVLAENECVVEALLLTDLTHRSAIEFAWGALNGARI